MKVAIYCRVSTDKQEVDNQLIQLREYCKNQDWEIYKEYADIVTGKEVNELNRPSFRNMFNDASKKLFDVVLFWDLSRFSRAGTLYTLKKLNELENYGIDWHSYSDKYLSSLGAFKDVVISLMATVAKQEREKISERTKAGMERARLKGSPIGKRGKDKKPRTKAGYFKKRGM